MTRIPWPVALAAIGLLLPGLSFRQVPSDAMSQRWTAEEVADDTLPVSFEAGLIHLTPRTDTGEQLVFCTDSGGGVPFVFEGSARRAGWLEDGSPLERIDIPSFRDQVPRPRVGPGGFVVRPDSVRNNAMEGCDGVLGSFWFADRVWTIDYPGRRFIHHPAGLPESVRGVQVPLGFQTDSLGRRTSHFPRIDVRIAGETLPLLLDTGARIRPTPRAREALGLRNGPVVVAASFIAHSIFERWREHHPDWLVVEPADGLHGGAPMIRVPEMSVGGVMLGPAWFTRRPSANFQEYLSQWMDQTVVGALGGSALRHSRVTVSYPHGVAIFRPAMED